MENNLEKSTVKWFNDKKGYGFIHGTEKTSGKDIFVHYMEVEDGALREGDVVEFKLRKGDRGMQATDVRISKIYISP